MQRHLLQSATAMVWKVQIRISLTTSAVISTSFVDQWNEDNNAERSLTGPVCGASLSSERDGESTKRLSN